MLQRCVEKKIVQTAPEIINGFARNYNWSHDSAVFHAENVMQKNPFRCAKQTPHIIVGNYVFFLNFEIQKNGIFLTTAMCPQARSATIQAPRDFKFITVILREMYSVVLKS